MPVVARVVLDSALPPLGRLFDYPVPAALEDDCVPGVRVKVPLRTGARMSDAWVVEVVAADADTTFAGELSPVEQVVSQVRAGEARSRPGLGRSAPHRAQPGADEALPRGAAPSRTGRAEERL